MPSPAMAGDRAVQPCLAADTAPATGSLAEATGPPQPYVPDAPGEDQGLLSLLLSVQGILLVIIAAIAVALLAHQVWSGRRERKLGDSPREE
ncbi:hypothetical protein SALBM135S_07613 [Streptomyces alboniger]